MAADQTARLSDLTPEYKMRLLCSIASLILLLAPAALLASDPPDATVDPVEEITTIILVRHAEKTAPSEDPPLSEAGQSRAETLAHALANANVDAVYATPYQRTRLTAEPLAERLGLEVRIASVRPSYGDEMARRLREEHLGQTVVAISHSNTVPELLTALGIDPAPEIADHQYDHLFIVTLAPNRPPQMLRLHYGVPTP